MKTISMLELRKDARKVLDALRRGERMLLTYRGEPVAHLEPIRSGRSSIPADDPVFRIEDFAVDGPGGAITSEEIDRIVYGL